MGAGFGTFGYVEKDKKSTKRDKGTSTGLAGEKMPTKRQKVAVTMEDDPDRELRRTRNGDFERIASEHFKDLMTATDLHPDGTKLCEAAVWTLTSTSENYWKHTPKGPNAISRIDSMDLRRGRRDGSRVGLVDLADVRAEAACGTKDCRCLAMLEQETIDHYGQLYAATEGTSGGAAVRWRVLKDAIIACYRVCDSGFNVWLGPSKEFVRNTREQARPGVERKPHGNKGRSASNELPGFASEATL